jgi:hypothetical protein
MAVRNFTTSSIKTNSQRNSFFSGAADLAPSTAIINNGSVYESINLTFGGTNASFGNTNNARSYAGALASSTRALAIGGYQGTQKTIEYVTIATAGNGTTFGNLVNSKYFAAGSGSATRGIISGGYPNTAYEYVTIATTGDATAFGNATAGEKEALGAFSSPTRSVDFGGNGASGYNNGIRYVTIATTGNGTSFGDLTVAKRYTSGCSTSVRGISQGGQSASGSSNYTNVIDYVTIATTGNATDFGDLSAKRGFTASASNSTRGFCIGGRDTSDASVSAIEYVVISTTGNSVSFGNVTTTYLDSACSSAHGGL